MSGTADVAELVDQLPGTARSDHGRYVKLSVAGRTFGYVWEPTVPAALLEQRGEVLPR